MKIEKIELDQLVENEYYLVIWTRPKMIDPETNILNYADFGFFFTDIGLKGIPIRGFSPRHGEYHIPLESVDVEQIYHIFQE